MGRSMSGVVQRLAPSARALRPDVRLGRETVVDDGVQLGYMPRRKPRNLVLQIGGRGVLRTGTVVYAGTRIGDGVETGHNVIIREDNEIGDDFRIWNNSVVDYGCTIGDRVKIHSNCYVSQFTTIEDDVFLAPGVSLANDPHPGSPRSLCMRGPTIKRGAQIGMGVVILPFVTIGECSLVGAGSVVTKDVPAFAVVVGNPARVIKTVKEISCPLDLEPGQYLAG